MKIRFSEDGWGDYQQWVETDPEMPAKVNALIEDARRRLFTGLGKPEPLKAGLVRWWSRRITGEHRLVYRIQGTAALDQHIEIASCRKHY